MGPYCYQTIDLLHIWSYCNCHKGNSTSHIPSPLSTCLRTMRIAQPSSQFLLQQHPWMRRPLHSACYLRPSNPALHQVSCCRKKLQLDSRSSPPSLLAEWSVLFAMGFYILDELTHGLHMGFMSLSIFLQSFMHGFNGSLCIFECLVYGFYIFFFRFALVSHGFYVFFLISEIF